MCCFLICFYNPNKFVSHTPRLEKGAVRQFRIAVCSQLRQRICCKAVAANKCRFPAVLQLRRHSGHRTVACTAAAAPSTAAGRRGRRAGALSHRENSRKAAATRTCVTPRLTRTRWPCTRLSAGSAASAGASLRSPSPARSCSTDCTKLHVPWPRQGGRALPVPWFGGQKPSARLPIPMCSFLHQHLHFPLAAWA